TTLSPHPPAMTSTTSTLWPARSASGSSRTTPTTSGSS
ncbi:MAG: 5-deoxy-glucuronate isomerase, partial [uncultured Rubrobacteraceae bacterium]